MFKRVILINNLEFNPIEKINLSKRKDPRPITLFISKEKKNIGKLAVIELLKLINVKNIKRSDIKIYKLDSGKPKVQLVDRLLNEEIYISFSHKDDLHLVAAGFKPIGVDIEKRREFSPKLIKKIFTRAESENIESIFDFLNHKKVEKNKHLIYTSLFSLKESTSKAIGLGLSIDFKKILINFKKNTIKIVISNFNSNFIGYITQKYGYIISIVEQVDKLN